MNPNHPQRGAATSRILAFLCVAFLATGCGSRSDAPPGVQTVTPTPSADLKDFKELVGAWEVIAIEAAGQPVPAERVQKLRLAYVFSELKKVSISRPDRPTNTVDFNVDATVNPKRLTIHLTPPVRAVYAVQGKTLKLCLMVDDNPNAGFPTELSSKASPKTDLLTLEIR